MITIHWAVRMRILALSSLNRFRIIIPSVKLHEAGGVLAKSMLSALRVVDLPIWMVMLWLVCHNILS